MIAVLGAYRRGLGVHHRALVVLAAGVLLLLAVARPAAAHPMDVGYLRIEVDGRTAVVNLDIDVNLAAILLNVDPHVLDEPTVTARLAELQTATYRAAPVTADGAECRWGGGTVQLRGRTVGLVDRADCRSPIHALRWAMPFASRAPPLFKLLVKARSGLGDQASIVDRAKPIIEVAAGSGAAGFADFVWIGVSHIGVAPTEWRDADGGFKLAEGVDHILFVLALLLGGGTIKQLAGITAGFTIAHSVTLAISVLGIVRPPSSVIEPLIALSIVVLAAEALTGKLPKYRWLVAAVCGLIHGFGFAHAFGGLDLSQTNLLTALAGYNVGVELGQLAIIVLFAPLVVLARRHASSSVTASKIASAVILVAGIALFVQRLIA